jgi:hypothetical protein
MKIEFLADGAPECPLVRLYNFTWPEIEELRAAFRDLAESRLLRYDVHERPWASPVDDCKLTFERSAKWGGMRLPTDRRTFTLSLPPEGWHGVGDLAAPFTKSDYVYGFQWLTDVTDSEVELLLSAGGYW